MSEALGGVRLLILCQLGLLQIGQVVRVVSPFSSLQSGPQDESRQQLMSLDSLMVIEFPFFYILESSRVALGCFPETEICFDTATVCPTSERRIEATLTFRSSLLT